MLSLGVFQSSSPRCLVPLSPLHITVTSRPLCPSHSSFLASALRARNALSQRHRPDTKSLFVLPVAFKKARIP